MTPLSIDHKEQISSLCTDLQIPLAEYTFANLYLFRTLQEFQVLALSEGLAVAGITYERRPFVLPLFHPKNWPSVIAEAHKPLFPIPEMWFDEARQQCIVDVNERDSDYIYETSSIQEYRGRHFDGHRNALRSLLDDHEVSARPLSPCGESGWV